MCLTVSLHVGPLLPILWGKDFCPLTFRIHWPHAFLEGSFIAAEVKTSHWQRKSHKSIFEWISESRVLLSVHQPGPGLYASLNSSRPRNSWVPPLMPFLLPSTDWFPFRDDCFTNPQPTRSRKPSDEDNKLHPGPWARRGEEWLMSPYILLVHSKSCLPQGLNHSLSATPRPDRGGRPAVVCWLGEGDAARALAGSKSCFLFFVFFLLHPIFWTGWWPWLPLGSRPRAALKGLMV